MNSITWNRKYRPTIVADLHLDFVRTQIQRMMDAGKIPQVLLFAGPKGTGKTSTSRIIGAIVNDQQNEKVVDKVYFKKEKPNQKLVEPNPNSEFNQKIFVGTSFVVQEMDAASNRGIDDVRQLKARAYLPPQEGKMSVFILDEAHMLTTEAFNALLKLLEEPPEHVIFILATTEIHKIPATIISRCQVVEFKKASNNEIINRLKTILINENISFEEDALITIAAQADGSFRDAIKLLELVAQSGNVTTSEVNVYTNTTISNQVEQLLKNLLNKDEIGVVELFEQLRAKNIDEQYFHKTLLEFIHTSLLQNLKAAPGESIINKAVAQFLLQELSNNELSNHSPIPHLRLELKILELIDRSKNKSGTTIKKNKKNNDTVLENSEIPSSAKAVTENALKVSSNETHAVYEKEFNAQINREDKVSDTINIQLPNQFTGNAKLLEDKWQQFIEVLAIDNSTLAVLLRSAKLVSVQEHSVVIGVYYNFHQEQLSQSKSISVIQNCMKQLLGDYIELEFILLKTPEKAELIEPQNADSLVNSALQALL